MKALKGSLVALVAILAVGLTVAMQAGAFETKAALVQDCFISGTFGDVSSSDCTESLSFARSTDLCSKIAIGDAIFSLTATTIDPSIGANCPGGTKLCCVRVVAQSQICEQNQIVPTGKPLAYYRVQSVFCQAN